MISGALARTVATFTCTSSSGGVGSAPERGGRQGGREGREERREREREREREQHWEEAAQGQLHSTSCY